MTTKTTEGPILGQTFIAGLWRENPVFRLLLGMCPTLAVTAAVKPALTMGLSVIFVLVCSNIVVSLMRNLLKPHLRILMFTLTISTFVTIADLFLRAFQPVMSERLGPYVPLIIVNCIIICRAEACASKNGLVVSIVDAVGMGIGFTLALCVLAGVRELLSTGMIFEAKVMPAWFVPWAAMSMPVGAFITLGLLLGLVNKLTKGKS
ncbi:MAG: electron transport complex subunit RsxE [Phycisphaerae bacterium]|nr:electron transport complex subunit RsxE [Phycisphaerae bacterium]NIP55159.1 electron transport complex subunit RsxE [Phycisphaerae bacterium]NIS53571.1 electron transport complex subunit RsxE [Phycisphaerae bacterium]NIU11463.1 electron transport complex subunit RsxE [Phycisphaerae bacterium]NIU55544.1 electron transport complex subunit RsxE [Phycisphaerae bacterium]